MGFNFVKWAMDALGGNKSKKTTISISGNEMFGLTNDIYIRELAFWSIVNRIGALVSKCEFKTYEKNKETKKEEYYMWNIEPNKNQNSSTFIKKMISKLYSENEVLVVNISNQLIVADSFSKETFATQEYIFSSITVDDLELRKTFTQSEVLYWELNSEDMRKIVASIYESYKALISHGMSSYKKSRGNKGVLNIDAIAEEREDFQEVVEELMQKRFKNFFEAENAVLPLFEGYKYTDIGSKTYSSEGTRDIKAMIDDITDFTARALTFPPALAKGDVQDTGKAIDELLTICIDPLTDMLSEEINRKRYGYKDFIDGTYMKIDTSTIKHIDIFDMATPIEKLVSSGVFCINDVLKKLGEQEINEPWANQRFITKNFSTIQEMIESFNKTE